jgi:hypothetical protein
MTSLQEIALSFFPLADSDFEFTIYRRSYTEGEQKSGFPTCTRRKLPISKGSDEWSEYWVKLDSKDIQGFEVFECNSFTNFTLTIELLFQLLNQSCQNNQLQNYTLGKDSFRYHTIFFALHDFYEGKQGVWLEPYFLKLSRKFGFLADFRFYVKEGVPFTKRIQQLSLSLDENGRSNINFYADRYEMLKEFTQRFHTRLFPLRYAEKEIHVEEDLLLMNSDSLRFKKYVFANNETDKSQFVGVKNKGPLTPIPTPVRVYFIYRESDRQFSLDLYRALRGDTFSSTFPGMEAMFRHKLSNENVSGVTIKDFTPGELERIISSILQDSGEIPVIPLLVIPFSKDDYDDEASEQYYAAKYTFLRHHLPSQFVSLKKLLNREQLKWAISNIALQLFAKMGGQPWKVAPETKNCLIVGLGQSHKKVNDKVEKYFAYSVLTDSSGLYKDIRILGRSNDLDVYLADFKQKLTDVFKQYINDYENFVVHTTFAIQDDELDAVNDVLVELSKNADSQKEFSVMRFDEHNKFFGYSRNSNSMIPYESSYIRIAEREFLVWFEGLQIQSPTVRKRIGRPLHVKFLYSSTDLDYSKMRNYLQDAVNLSGANWRGFNAKSLPVSVYYAQLVARYYKEFQALGFEDINLEKITPWFL